MTDGILIVLVGVLLLVGTADLALTIRKRRPQIIQQADFRCPYCETLVTGDRPFDIIQHVSCIEDAQEAADKRLAIEQEATQRAEIEAKEKVSIAEIHAKENADARRLAAEKKETDRLRSEEEREARKHEYTVQIQRVGHQHSVVHKVGCQWQWTITNPFGQVDKGLGSDRVHAQKEAVRAIANAKAGKPPIGELIGTFTVR